MAKNKTISIEQITEKTELRFTLDEVGGKELAQIRVWIKGDGDEFIPTRKGVAFPRTHIKGVLDGVTKLKNKIEE
tara:strand:+ start:1052 stop:1276 length:225 start_codon:yes stop_codon:yes gene_type:complete